MTLLHYSEQPLEAMTRLPRIAAKARIRYKPLGLWVSVEGEDDWPSWGEYNWPSWFDAIRHVTEVVVRPGANLLVIDDVVELCALNKRYPSMHGDYFQSPDWEAVAADFQGIVIAPYQWEVRMSLQWYYTWDCASGCIWDPAAVESLIPRPEKLPRFKKEA